MECVTPKMKELFKNLILNMKLNGTKEDEDKVENIERNYDFDKTIKEIAHYYAGIGERNMEKAVRSTLRAFGNDDEDIDYIMSTANNVLAAAKEENKKILEQSSD